MLLPSVMVESGNGLKEDKGRRLLRWVISGTHHRKALKMMLRVCKEALSIPKTSRYNISRSQNIYFE